MLGNLYKAIGRETSGVRAHSYVRAIASYHRMQATPGFTAAAQWCAGVLRQNGLETRVLDFPSGTGHRYWGCMTPDYWEGESGDLYLLLPGREPERLASFSERKISMLARSMPTPPGGVTADLVVLVRGDDEAAFDGVDVRGKVVLGGGAAIRFRELALERGAIGIITDDVPEIPQARPPMDIPDAIQYASFWWTEDEPRAFGFALSPRQGAILRQRLAELASKARERGETPPRVQVRAEVKARFSAGALNVVEAFIPGQTDEEVLMVAHLCHPEPSANDNASGCSALMEAAAALDRMIKDGKLPAPRRGLRFLLVPEMLGTYAYLSQDEERIGKWVGGLNLDMVGEDQAQCRGSLLAECPARALPSFAGTLLARALREAVGGAKTFTGSVSFPAYRHDYVPFTGGSDHFILSDPTVGVPTPMIIQWPDRFYHTSMDTPERVDPRILGRVSAAAATYVYFLAQAGFVEACWLAEQVACELSGELRAAVGADCEGALEAAGCPGPAPTTSPAPGKAAGKAAPEVAADLAARAARFARRVDFLRARKLLDAGSVERLIEPARRGEFARFLGHLGTRMDAEAAFARDHGLGLVHTAQERLGIAKLPPPAGPAPADTEAQGLVPVRKYRGPLHLDGWQMRLVPEERVKFGTHVYKYRELVRHLMVVAMYWMDGRRSLAEVSDMVEMETGRRETAFLIESCRWLERLGLLELKPAK